MATLLKSHIIFTTLLFTIFGGVLAQLFKVDDVPSYIYVSLACVFSLISTLLTSLLLSGKWTKKLKVIYLLTICTLSILSVLRVIQFVSLFDKSTFTYTVYGIGPDSIPVPIRKLTLLRSGDYTDTVASILKINPDIDKNKIDSTLIDDFAGGVAFRTRVYKPGSLEATKRKLIFCYIILIILITITICIPLEILWKRYNRWSAK